MPLSACIDCLAAIEPSHARNGFAFHSACVNAAKLYILTPVLSKRTIEDFFRTIQIHGKRKPIFRRLHDERKAIDSGDCGRSAFGAWRRAGSTSMLPAIQWR